MATKQKSKATVKAAKTNTNVKPKAVKKAAAPAPVLDKYLIPAIVLAGLKAEELNQLCLSCGIKVEKNNAATTENVMDAIKSGLVKFKTLVYFRVGDDNKVVMSRKLRNYKPTPDRTYFYEDGAITEWH